MERPVKPVTITLLDETEHRLRLSMGAVKRLKERFKVNLISELLNRDASDSVPILYEALPKEAKATMSEEDFADLVPANLEVTIKLVAALFGMFVPESNASNGNPTPEGSQIVQ